MSPAARHSYCAIVSKMKHFALLLSLMVGLSCSRSLERQFQQQVASFENASLGEDQVQVTDIRTIGDQAVAEIQIKTGVKMIKRAGKWEIDEIRIGDRRWEKASHILELVNAKRRETTLQQLRLIEKGIGEFSRIHGTVPQVSDFRELVDTLTPDIQKAVVRLDAWSNPFHYQPNGQTSYDLRSAGPDGRLGTADDLKGQGR